MRCLHKSRKCKLFQMSNLLRNFAPSSHTSKRSVAQSASAHVLTCSRFLNPKSCYLTPTDVTGRCAHTGSIISRRGYGVYFLNSSLQLLSHSSARLARRGPPTGSTFTGQLTKGKHLPLQSPARNTAA